MIRAATLADAALCAAIYAPYVSDSSISFEAQPPDTREVARRMQTAHLWLVAEEAGDVCGYAYGSAHREREAYQWAADVAIYLDGRHRGRGLGRALYEQLFDGLHDLGVCVVCAGVALPNPASEALHRATGFAEIGVYRRIAYKLNRWLDVRWYQRSLRFSNQPPPAPPTRARSSAWSGHSLATELDHILRHNPNVALAAARATDAIRAHTGWRWVGIYTLDDGQVTNLAWSGPAAPAHPTFTATEGLTATAISTRHTVLCPDVTSDPRYLTNQHNSGSEMIVPIIDGDAVLGTLDVESELPHAFANPDQLRAEQLAQKLAALWTPRPSGTRYC